jgi:hypothetical protein
VCSLISKKEKERRREGKITEKEKTYLNTVAIIG